MKRVDFIRNLAILPLATERRMLQSLFDMIDKKSESELQPVLFLGHGSPMNAIEENEFVKGFRDISKTLGKPKAVLCISAHWETNGTRIATMEKPRTIHDFGGFPKDLFEVQYPAPGHPSLAKETQNLLSTYNASLDYIWGLDHGAWSVIKHLYPSADVPVFQLSLDKKQTPEYHFELAKELVSLRKRGVLVIGSGNIVHNLSLVDWRRLNEQFSFDWAKEADSIIKSYISSGDFKALTQFRKLNKSLSLAIPTPEHYLPLLYILALKEKNDQITYFNDKPLGGALTMTSLLIQQD
jgi:4,5-DOPA dioxygenase extradiol